MAVIADFPPEILSIITQGLDGFDIANLWLSGDTGLRLRMENGGVTRFTLELRQEKTRKWPKLISRFLRLEYLSIRPKRRHSIWFRDVDLFGISATLKHLEMNFENSELVLLGIPFVVEDLYPDPILSPPTHAEMSLAPFPMAERFPELHTLVLIGQPGIPHILVPQLPQSLLRLHLPYTDIDSAIFQFLPPHLTFLQLPNLTKLRNEPIFPSDLTCLYLDGLNAINPELVSSFPRSVTDLRLQSLGSSDATLFSLLPPNLTSLYIGWNTECRDDISEHLPQSIRHLKLCIYEAAAKRDFFPPGLHSLTTTQWGIFSAEPMSFLPRSITKLRMRNIQVTEETIQFLPDNLRDLALDMRLLACPSPYSFMKSLQTLHVKEIDPQVLEFMPDLSKIRCGSFSSDGGWSTLKPLSRLRKIHVTSSMKLEDSFLQWLPDSLEHLAVSFSKSESSPISSHYLPRSLHTLILATNALPEDSDLFITQLPPRLTKLCLGGQACCISDQSIRLLPRTLETLHLDSATELTDDAIPHLPRSLTDCRLESVTGLTDKSAALFPRHLRSLSLNRCTNISNAAMPHFPRTLSILYLSQSRLINEACVRHVPPLLHLLFVPDLPTKTTVAIRHDYRAPSPAFRFIASQNELYNQK